MTPPSFVVACSVRGVRLFLDADRLTAEPLEKLPASALRYIESHNAELRALISGDRINGINTLKEAGNRSGGGSFGENAPPLCPSAAAIFDQSDWITLINLMVKEDNWHHPHELHVRLRLSLTSTQSALDYLRERGMVQYACSGGIATGWDGKLRRFFTSPAAYYRAIVGILDLSLLTQEQPVTHPIVTEIDPAIETSKVPDSDTGRHKQEGLF